MNTPLPSSGTFVPSRSNLAEALNAMYDRPFLRVLREPSRFVADGLEPSPLETVQKSRDHNISISAKRKLSNFDIVEVNWKR